MKRKIILIWLIFALAISLLIFFNQRMWGGSIQTILEERFVPTAEYLLQYPIAIPFYIGNISPYSEKCLESNEINVLIFPELIDKNSKYNIMLYSKLYINNKRLPHSYINTTDYAILHYIDGKPTGQFALSAQVELEEGIHIAELQIFDSFVSLLTDNVIASYTWAFCVE